MKIYYYLCILAVGVMVSSCGSCKRTADKVADVVEVAVEDGWVTVFDGTSLDGWRGYNRTDVPAKWVIEPDGTLKFNGSGTGEAQTNDGGDLIYDKKMKNFELELEWKISKGGNSGIFYLAQEIPGEPIYLSGLEYQLLDNENHPDALAGKDGNRKSGSLYDLVPAVPQNAKPFGEWNKAKIIVHDGSVFHFQNDVLVVETHLWTPGWTALLNTSKFGEKAWPAAFAQLNNVGGPDHMGYIGLQDHGNDVWFRNIRIKNND